MHSYDRAELMSRRFRDELGYASALPWAIFDREQGRRVMYYMIHATDHPRAPSLMSRAYEKAVQPKEPIDQLAFELGTRSATPALPSTASRPKSSHLTGDHLTSKTVHPTA